MRQVVVRTTYRRLRCCHLDVKPPPSASLAGINRKLGFPPLWENLEIIPNLFYLQVLSKLNPCRSTGNNTMICLLSYRPTTAITRSPRTCSGPF